MPTVQSSSSAKKGSVCHAILNKEERLFQSTTDIYIYMKVDKCVAEIKFCYPMFTCEGKL